MAEDWDTMERWESESAKWEYFRLQVEQILTSPSSVILGLILSPKSPDSQCKLDEELSVWRTLVRALPTPTDIALLP